MNLSRFRHSLMRLVGSTEGEEPFHAMRMQMGGLSSPKAMKIINFAVKSMEKNECYMEIGCFTGYSLCAAAYQNGHWCIGIDDLSLKDFYAPEIVEAEREKVRSRIFKNIDSMFNSQRIVFLERDFRTIKKFEFDPPTMGIGVFYIDGFHSYEQTKEAFEWVEPYLADEAIIFVDDLHMPQVAHSVLEQVFSGKFTLLFYAMHASDMYDNFSTLDEYIATGLAILQYRRKK